MLAIVVVRFYWYSWLQEILWSLVTASLAVKEMSLVSSTVGPLLLNAGFQQAF